MNPATATAKVASAAVAGADQISLTLNTSRNVTIQINNNSDTFSLANPRTHNISGCCYHPPQPTIKTKTQETCTFSKTSYAARGSVGVLTYQIHRKKSNPVGELAIMFSVPYDYSLFENWFALGIFEANIPCNYDLFKRMYYDGDGYDDLFTREKGTGGVITYSGKGVLVKGTMSAFGQSIIKVELWDEDLAALD
ncbi:DELTA-sagatoxin-Srs1a-like [Colossoma macropomum]|uniref:DELTA-sagatoxin-Srs1a-like n=1 Tax=Colossoma macropomum TaxID=42526 RepID=UPI0018648903|nr:DELTA-sagatoxin-Srs1a-like [Colossoma macropomum]